MANVVEHYVVVGVAELWEESLEVASLKPEKRYCLAIGWYVFSSVVSAKYQPVRIQIIQFLSIIS